MKKPIFKTISLGLLSLATILSFNSCGGSGGSKPTAINNDTLYSFMLGGVYFFHGYGGANEVFNNLVAAQMNAKPGDDGYLPELANVYSFHFKFPFKTSEGSGCRSTLSEAWGADNKENFMKSLNELITDGHHTDYLACRKAIDENGGANADIAKIDLSKYKLSVDDNDRLEFVKAHLSEFNKAGIKAWDIARYVNNVAQGYCAGYISEVEGLDLMKKLHPIAKENYASWKEYYTDYDLGRRFWGGDKEHDKEFGDVAVKMLEGDHSIFQYMAFK
jgi:Protein of unknown function (DUF1266)